MRSLVVEMVSLMELYLANPFEPLLAVEMVNLMELRLVKKNVHQLDSWSVVMSV